MDALYHANLPAPAARCCFGSPKVSACSDPFSTAALGTTETLPLRITTPLKLPEGAWVWLVSPSPVKVIASKSGAVAQLTCHTPVLFTAQTETWITPTDPLDHAFTNGWAKIPDELRLQIIGETLTYPHPIDSRHSFPFTALPQLMHHLRIMPEVAALATQIFYTSNTFAVCSSRIAFRCPKPAVNNLVRRLEFELRLRCRRGWQQLIKLANGNYGFSNLRSVHVVLDLNDVAYEVDHTPNFGEVRARLDIRWPGEINFKCKGKIVLRDRGPLSARRSNFNPTALEVETTRLAFEALLERKITFG
ncbi:hypothetical protein CC86DRAFT_407792 [Ophiobolus disseminans]|uniref:Uncharacterized protein n=1 Tax=Ophiobolus disseminans TaxID=1469910 RepID=A0A6A6ZWC4_9PLEO|nr:hypothetical protein CC86DRAFT_407792 [Ophiobolus disseminans]